MFPTEKITLGINGGSIEIVIVDRPEKFILCVPSQLGCSMGCKICRAQSFIRNLTSIEIQNLIDLARRYLNDSKPRLLSFMGVGEPSLNLSVVYKIIVDNMFDKYAISTVGANDDVFYLPSYIKIQLSLNASNNLIRKALMPNVLSIDEIFRSSQHLKKIDVNYVLIKDWNDLDIHAEELAKLLKFYNRNTVKINRYNETGSFLPSNRTEQFLEILKENEINPEYYETDGREINAACGQMV